MKQKKAYDWLLTSCNSDNGYNDFQIYKNRTIKQIKKEMVKLIKDNVKMAINEEYGHIDFATIKVSDITNFPAKNPSELLGFINFNDSHTNYQAVRIDTIRIIE